MPPADEKKGTNNNGKPTMNDNQSDEQPLSKKARLREPSDDGKEEAKKEEEKKEEKEAREGNTIDTSTVAKLWSPQRASRPGIKIRSLVDGNLRGGDFVLNADGDACTISFLFEKDNNIYGLTAGHLARVGDNLEVFAESTADNDGTYSTTPIGAVVAVDYETDSLIFQVLHPHVVPRVDLLKVSPQTGLGSSLLQLPNPDSNPPQPPEGIEVVVCGAKRRGAHGVVVIGCNDSRGSYSKIGDIGIASKTQHEGSISYGTEGLTDLGDCGALYLDAATGVPIAMHHCLQNPKQERGDGMTEGYVSFGIPLANIFSKHSLLGGQSGREIQEQQLLSPAAAAKSQTRNMTVFKTKPSTKFPPMPGMSQPRRQSPNIAKFKTRRVFLNDKGERISTSPF